MGIFRCDVALSVRVNVIFVDIVLIIAMASAELLARHQFSMWFCLIYRLCCLRVCVCAMNIFRLFHFVSLSLFSLVHFRFSNSFVFNSEEQRIRDNYRIYGNSSNRNSVRITFLNVKRDTSRMFFFNLKKK